MPNRQSQRFSICHQQEEGQGPGEGALQRQRKGQHRHLLGRVGGGSGQVRVCHRAPWPLSYWMLDEAWEEGSPEDMDFAEFSSFGGINALPSEEEDEEEYDEEEDEQVDWDMGWWEAHRGDTGPRGFGTWMDDYEGQEYDEGYDEDDGEEEEGKEEQEDDSFNYAALAELGYEEEDADTAWVKESEEIEGKHRRKQGSATLTGAPRAGRKKGTKGAVTAVSEQSVKPSRMTTGGRGRGAAGATAAKDDKQGQEQGQGQEHVLRCEEPPVVAVTKQKGRKSTGGVAPVGRAATEPPVAGLEQSLPPTEPCAMATELTAESAMTPEPAKRTRATTAAKRAEAESKSKVSLKNMACTSNVRPAVTEPTPPGDRGMFPTADSAVKEEVKEQEGAGREKAGRGGGGGLEDEDIEETVRRLVEQGLLHPEGELMD
ncbi:unnamed protein product, partial [Discosporangium mesarthrocarpum]